MEIFDLLGAVFAADEVGDIFHRSRTIERDHGDDVFEDRRFQLFQIAFHAGRFELEDAGRSGFLEHPIGSFIIDR